MPNRILIAALALSGASLFAATNPQPGVEVQMILTSADHMNHNPPALQSADIAITDATITDWLPFEGGNNLELFIVIDDSADYDFAARLQELKRFVTSQPASTSIGVAYIHDGELRIVEDPTTDHEMAARDLRSPSGSGTANPYGALSELIQGWKTKSLRREVVLVGAGLGENAETATRDAERAGVVVYTLYNPPNDYVSQDWSKIDAGLVSLASVSYETGGEAYFVGHTPSLSIEPFLADISEHLAHQYLVRFRVTPMPDGAFQTLFVTSDPPDRELMKPERIWVPGAGE
jgi:hypothetical protein